MLFKCDIYKHSKIFKFGVFIYYRKTASLISFQNKWYNDTLMALYNDVLVEEFDVASNKKKLITGCIVKILQGILFLTQCSLRKEMTAEWLSTLTYYKTVQCLHKGNEITIYMFILKSLSEKFCVFYYTLSNTSISVPIELWCNC